MNYIVFDLEATCWNSNVPMQHEIIEIGAVKIHTKYYKNERMSMRSI